MENYEINNPVPVPIVIPSYEPDERLIALLHDLDDKAMGPVIIINDGSSEEYDPIFKEAESIITKRGGKFISYRPNRGKGRALKTAFQYITENYPGALGCVTADSDGQHTPECINNIIDTLKAHPDNLILGVRQFDKKSIPWKSWFGNTLTIKVFSYVAGMKVSDTQSGLRGIPFAFMMELIDCKGERFEYEMQMLLECAGRYNLTEVPIQTIYESKENHQTHFKPIRDSLRIYKILGKKFLKFIFASLSSFVVDIILFHLFVLLFKGTFPALYVTFATVAARVISAVYNYFINYKFVFKSKASRSTSLTKYALLAIIQMSLSAGLVSLVVFLIPNCWETLVKTIVDTTLFLISYSIQQRFVFSSKSKTDRNSKET